MKWWKTIVIYFILIFYQHNFNKLNLKYNFSLNYNYSKNISYFLLVLYLYAILQREDIICNMNHVAKLTESFILREPDISLNLLFTHNILFSFMLYLNFPLMRNFFLFLIGNLYHHSYLNIKNQTRLWKYLGISNFFIDLANLMLTPFIEKFNMQKTVESFHPFDLSPFLIQKEIKKENNNEITKKDENEDQITPLFEEYTGFRTDIDRIKSMIHQKKTFLITRAAKQAVLCHKIKSLEIEKMSTPQNEEKGDSIPIIKTHQDIFENKEKESIFKSSLLRKQSIRISAWKKQKTIDISQVESEKILNKLEKTPQKMQILTSPSKISQTSGEFFVKEIKNIRKKSDFKSMSSISEFKNNTHNIITKTNKISEKNSFLPKIEQKQILLNKDFSSPKSSNFKKMLSLVPGKTFFDQKIARQQPYITEVIEESKLKINLKQLYPQSLEYIKESEVDRKAKDSLFTKEKIIEGEYYAIFIAEILSITIKNAIENYINYNLKKKMEYVTKDYTFLFIALFSNEEGKFLELVFEVIKKIFFYFYF